jgi:hypothetical protein
MDIIKQAKNLFYENISLIENCRNDNSLLYLTKLKHVPQCIKDVRQKIIEQYDLHDSFNNPQLHDFIFEAKPGKYLSPHTDHLQGLKENEYTHLRANWVVQAPENDVFIFCNEGELQKVVENNFYLIDALEPHGISKVYGKRSLLLYSFGFLKKQSNYV